jgi:hypothetical protein
MSSCLPFRVTGIASRTEKTIPTHVIMFVREASSVFMLMAIYAAKGLIIVWRSMAFTTLTPGVLMPSVENGKICLVMLLEVSGIPTWLSGVTNFTIG